MTTTIVSVNNLEAACLIEQELLSIELFILQLLVVLISIKVEGEPQFH